MLYYIKQNLIAIDQFANALFGGYADETISARAYRMSLVSAHWVYVRKAIDLLFFFERNHCYLAWVSEFERHQLPMEYRL